MNHHAIYALYPNVVQIFDNDGINIKVGAFDAEGKQVEIDLDLIESWVDPTKYQRDRIYPTWQEQMDLQYWDSVNGTTTWKDAVAKVKSDNPKPE